MNTSWKSLALFGVVLLLCCCVEAFVTPLASSSKSRATAADTLDNSALRMANSETSNNSDDAPPLTQKPPRNVMLMVEPTPFTHVSGYANRFKEMLHFLHKAGDNVDILTVDAKTPQKELPTDFATFPIFHTLGFTFPLYNQISLTCDLPEAKGAQIIEARKPDLIHVTSPWVFYFPLETSSQAFSLLYMLPLLTYPCFVSPPFVQRLHGLPCHPVRAH